jgi:GTP:adenosylcobinamide-phosphate guanylyltransferase
MKPVRGGTGIVGNCPNSITRSSLSYRTPTLNIVQVRARLLEDVEDLEFAIRALPENPVSSVTSDLAMIESCAGRITQALQQRMGVMF